MKVKIIFRPSNYLYPRMCMLAREERLAKRGLVSELKVK